MKTLEDPEKTPPQLGDALARIDQAKDNLQSLEIALNGFLDNYVRGMVQGYNKETDGFVLRLRHSSENYVSGKPVVLVSQIVESLRTALDYLVFQLSKFNEPNLNEREPQFVIADKESTFHSQARTRLRHLTAEQKSFLEQIQPYHGNGLLALLGELAVRGKHRRLLELQNATGLRVISAEITKRNEYQDFYMYPMGKGHATFARPIDKPAFLLMGKYDAVPLLNYMIGHVEDVVWISRCFFQGRPLNVTILSAEQQL